MKTKAQLKEEIYEEVSSSGLFRNLQAQLKTFVFDLIEKEYKGGKTKIGFQYEHTRLLQIKNYPPTSLCLDIIQQFLQSFKFKHTLNVFKKEINRNVSMNRSHLAQSFRIQIKNPDSQAVLLSLVKQMMQGDIGALKTEIKINNYFDTPKTQQDRTNNFMGDTKKINEKYTQPSKIPNPPQVYEEKPSKNISNSNNTSSNVNNSSSFNSNVTQNAPKIDSSQSSSIKIDTSKQDTSKLQEPPKEEQDKKGKKKDTKGKKPAVVEKEKPPENATDLLGDVMKKFEGKIKAGDKEKEKKELFESKRAFSEEKEKKVLDPSESGANKIRGASMGKNMSSFMSKFMPQTQQAPKNQSFIDEQLDEFQQSKDSTRKNPLYSSSQSGFDKSGFDQSVDSSAIEEYEYIQRAKKFSKK